MKIPPAKTDDNVLLEALTRHVCHRAQLALPENKRGLRAQGPLEAVVKRELPKAIEWLVKLAVEEAEPSIPAVAPLQDATGRVPILDNDQPCTRCRAVRKVAVVEVKAGERVLVECEQCAPEFTGR